MISNIWIQGWFGFYCNHRYFYLIDSFLSWSKVARKFKNLVCKEFLLIRLKMNLLKILLWDLNYVLYFGLRKIFYLEFFCSVYSSKSGSKIYFSLILNFNIWFCACTNESHFGISPRHIIKVDIDCWIISFVLGGSKLNCNYCKTFGLNEANFGEKSKCFISIMTHSVVNWCVRLIV